MKTSDMPEMKGGNLVSTRKKYISLFPKPNNEGENYRFRLLWYKQSSKNDRKTPYFTQMIHDHWGENENGKKVIDDVVICPGTKYVHYDEDKFVLNEKTGKKYLNCPICMKSNENFTIAKSSGWRDKVATKRSFALKAKFRAIVPVYVVHDPNAKKIDENGNEKFVNDGTMKVLIFTDKDEFERFDTLVNEEKSKAYLASKDGNGYEVFNGTNAVDFYLHMDTVKEVRNQGKPNEYEVDVRKITGMKFGSKAYDITSINEDSINSFEMDDQYYLSNTRDELQEFYDKHYGHDEAKAAPEEDIDMFSDSVPEKRTERGEDIGKTLNVTMMERTSTAQSISEAEADDIADDLTEDPDNLPPPDEPSSVPDSKPMSNSEIDDILGEM